MAIRLVALDLDRTLVGFDGKVSHANREAVSWAQSRGVAVTLATSRRFPPAARFAEELNIDAPLITFGGAYVAERDQSRVYLEKGLERELWQGVLNFACTNAHPVMVYTVTGLLTNDREAVLATGYWRAREVRDWRPEAGKTNTIVQVMAVGRAAVQAIGKYVDDEFPGRFRYDIFTQQKVWTGHLLHCDTSKGRALADLAAQLEIDRSEVMAMGDECSDRDMVAWAGTGIAMSWAIPDVLAVADDVTPDGDADGVATMLYRYLQ